MYEEYEVKINEDMLLGSMFKSFDLYMITENLNLQEWFFESEDNKMMFRNLQQICYYRTHGEAKATILGKKDRLAVKFKDLMDGNIDFYINMMKEDDWLITNMIDQHLIDRRSAVFSDINRECLRKISLGEDIAEQIDAIKKLTPGHKKVDIMNAKDIIEAMDNAPQEDHFISEIETIDEKLDIFSSSLLVLAGESSTGKTTLANQMLYQFLSNKNTSAIYFSLETSQVRLGQRFVKHIAAIEDTDYLEAKRKFADMQDRLMVTKLCADLDNIEGVIRSQHKKDEKLKFIVVDYVQIIDVAGIDNENQVVATAAKTLHFLAQELNLVVILLCQLRKEEESRVVKGVAKITPPTMNSLRGSKSIANAADYIGILQFSDLGNARKDLPRKTNLHVVKSKEGCQFVAPLIFFGKKLTFKADI